MPDLYRRSIYRRRQPLGDAGADALGRACEAETHEREREKENTDPNLPGDLTEAERARPGFLCAWRKGEGEV